MLPVPTLRRYHVRFVARNGYLLSTNPTENRRLSLRRLGASAQTYARRILGANRRRTAPRVHHSAVAGVPAYGMIHRLPKRTSHLQSEHRA